MNKTIVFDMDGTIANFYGVDNWLNDIRNENTRPYDIAEPIYDMDVLNAILLALKSQGWRIAITTWLAMGSSVEFENATRRAKLNWLAKYDFPYDEIHLIRYGRTKADATRKNGGYQILVDDNAKIRQGWSLGSTIDANSNILDALITLLD
jgi:hypothetical protein